MQSLCNNLVVLDFWAPFCLFLIECDPKSYHYDRWKFQPGYHYRENKMVVFSVMPWTPGRLWSAEYDKNCAEDSSSL